jgi:hypothetical protein
VKGIKINDVPVELLIKYFDEQDLQDTLLLPSTEDEVKAYYEYTVAVGSNSYTFFSQLDSAASKDLDTIKSLAVFDLLDLEGEIELLDIDSVTKESGSYSGQIYLSSKRIGVRYPNRYRFVYSTVSSAIQDFVAIEGSISDDITDTTAITISDSRTGENLFGSSTVNLVLREAEGYYEVYNASTAALLGRIYENEKSRVQRYDVSGRELYIDESGNETTSGLRQSRFLRHLEAVRSSLAPGYISDPREITSKNFIPGVIGIYKQGRSKELLRYLEFIRTKTYTRVPLDESQEYIDSTIPRIIRQELPDIDDSYEETRTEFRVKKILDFNLEVAEVVAAVLDEPNRSFYKPSLATISNGQVAIVTAKREIARYNGITGEVSLLGSQQVVTEGSRQLDLVVSESGIASLRIPIEKRVNLTANKYYEQRQTSTTGKYWQFSPTTNWVSTEIREVLSTQSESDLVFIDVLGVKLSYLKKSNKLLDYMEIQAGTEVMIAGDRADTGILKRVKSDRTGLENAPIPASSRVYSRDDQSYNGAQKNGSMYTYASSPNKWFRTSISRVRRPSESDLWDEYVKIRRSKGTSFEDVEYTVNSSQNGSSVSLINPVIDNKTFQIKSFQAGMRSIYSLGYIEYQVEEIYPSSRTGNVYFGQISGLTGSGQFTLAKYSPAYSVPEITPEDFELDGYVLNSLDGSYSREYYVRDLEDRNFGVFIEETISISGGNATNSSVPKWTEFLDYEHQYKTSGWDFRDKFGSGVLRGSAVSISSTLEEFERRFSSFRHFLVDGSLRLSVRGDLVPDDAFLASRRRAIADMAIDFINRPGSQIFTPGNLGYDEDSPMKMRVYAEGLLKATTGYITGKRASKTGLTSASEISGTVSLERLDRGRRQAEAFERYEPEAEESLRDYSRAAAAISSKNSIQRILAYKTSPTMSKAIDSELARITRDRVMAQHTSSQMAIDSIDVIDKTPRSYSVSRSDFKEKLAETMAGFFFDSNTYYEGDYYLNDYYKYYKGKMDRLGPSYNSEIISGRPTYKKTLSRKQLAESPVDLVELVIGGEGGDDWRVL